MKGKLLNFFNIILLIINVFLLIYYLSYPVISNDSGYYLSIARDIYLNKKIYFIDIGTTYNPIAIFINGLPFLFWTAPPFWIHLLIILIIKLLSTYFFYKILFFINKNIKENIFFSLYFLLLELVVDGRHILLEPVTVLFMLVSLLFYFKFKQEKKSLLLLLTGVFISFAFLSKQYGLFIIIPIGYDLLRNLKSNINKLYYFIIGLISPIILFYIYLFDYGISIELFLLSILGKGINLDKGTGTSISTSFFTYPMDTIYIILFNLYFILIPRLLYKNRNRIKNLTFFLLLPISSFLVLFFANYWHYYQLIIPFSLLFFIVLFSNTKKEKRDISYYAIVLSTIIITTYSYVGIDSKAFNDKKEALENNNLTKIVPSGSDVYLDGIATSYYYIYNYHSIDLKNISYTFPGYFHPKTILKFLDIGEFIIVSPKKIKQYQKVLDNKYTISNIVINNQDYYIIIKNNHK